VEEIIKAKSKFSLDIKELIQYKELFYFFAWRDIKVKYSQTFLGITWAIIQPLVLMFVFTKFIGQPLKIATGGMPYEIFAFSGLVLWIAFSSAVQSSANSLVVNANIIKKIYFPRLIIPISSVLTSIFDSIFGLVLLILMLIYFKLSFTIVLLPCLFVSLFLTILAAIGIGTWLSALNIKYKDFRYALPFIIQLMLFVTPVIYDTINSSNAILKFISALNPMVAPIQLLRYGIDTQASFNFTAFAISVCSNCIIFMLGLFTFKKMEMYFSDLA
jgi:lipopolysaccharide transport system permease protein